MKATKNILIVIITLFTIATATLLLLAVFEVTGSEETRQSIVKLAQACGIITGAAAILFGLSSFAKK
ncbi:MAG TPA: hypothetical protein VFX86_02280 [Candidatus Saccharimonadales bacterium]|nr:hypothetical protein [Candidatus Saccharimonadales bacterium]